MGLLDYYYYYYYYYYLGIIIFGKYISGNKEKGFILNKEISRETLRSCREEEKGRRAEKHGWGTEKLKLRELPD